MEGLDSIEAGGCVGASANGICSLLRNSEVCMGIPFKGRQQLIVSIFNQLQVVFFNKE